jgi:hypothetical protein
MPRKIGSGIKYKLYLFIITCPLQLSSSDSEFVSTPPDVGSMLAPCLYGRGFDPSGHFSTE